MLPKLSPPLENQSTLNAAFSKLDMFSAEMMKTPEKGIKMVVQHPRAGRIHVRMQKMKANRMRCEGQTPESHTTFPNCSWNREEEQSETLGSAAPFQIFKF